MQLLPRPTDRSAEGMLERYGFHAHHRDLQPTFPEASPHISHWGSGERGSRLGSVVSMTRVQECHEAVKFRERGRRPSRSDVSGSVDCAVSGACQAAAFRNRA